MRQRYFWIYIVAFLFIFGGFMVTMYHHHQCAALYDVSNHQIYCHYVKNPVLKDSILFIVPTLLLIAAIYLPLFVRRKKLYSVNPDFFQRQYLIFLSAFSYRAPPLK